MVMGAMTMPELVSIASAIIALIAAVGAWGAVLVNRRNAIEAVRAQVNTGARSSRAAVVSANRQRWIDAIRDDLADFIATKYQLSDLMRYGGSGTPTGVDALLTEERQLIQKLQMLHARIDMRLNHGEEDHLTLLTKLVAFDATVSPAADAELRTQARSIFKAEWARLKREASGINPFVQE